MDFRVVALWFLVACTARSQIAWKSDEFRIEAEPGVSSIEGIFEFGNNGTVPVRVEKLKAACGCTVVAADRGPVAPGGTGAIRVTFKPGDRRGWYETAIYATVGGETAKLRFVAGLIPALEVAPKALLWRKGERPEPKLVTLTRQRGPVPVSVTVERGTGGFKTVVEKDASRGLWVVRFAPQGAGGGRGFAEIRVALGDGRTERFSVYLRDQR